jgi:hypothetical protein
METKSVWLVYEDGYGGLFSPYVLTKVYESESEAWKYAKGKYATVVERRYAGTLNVSAYPYYYGGKYSD